MTDMLAFINLGTLEVTVLLASLLALYFCALFLVIKNEVGTVMLFWTVFVLFVPILPAVIYIVRHYWDRNRKNTAA